MICNLQEEVFGFEFEFGSSVRKPGKGKEMRTASPYLKNSIGPHLYRKKGLVSSLV